MPLRNADKIFYMTNFTRNLPIGNYSLYYLTSKTLVFRWKLLKSSIFNSTIASELSELSWISSQTSVELTLYPLVK